MKTLGLIGGMSWESTASYYRLLNQMARQALGGRHSAELVMWSVDFAPIADLQAAGEWDALTARMIDAARRLEGAGAQGLLICANTMHRMADEVAAAISIPLIHVADATAAAVSSAGARRPLLLATRYTMEQAFYRDRLARRGVDALVPGQADRDELQRIIFEELVQGVLAPASKTRMLAIVEAARAVNGVDAVILGCTEFSLLVGPGDFDLPCLDTTEIHARAGMDFALG